MSAKITVALLLMALAVGCEPEPMLNLAVALKPVSAGEDVSTEGPLPAGENGDDGRRNSGDRETTGEGRGSVRAQE